MTHRRSGFTIVETIVVIMILSIISFLAIPKIHHLYEDMRLINDAYELSAQIHYARSRIMTFQPSQPAPEELPTQTWYPVLTFPGDGTYAITNVPHPERPDETGIVGPRFGTTTVAGGTTLTFDMGGSPINVSDPVYFPIYDYQHWDPLTQEEPPVIGWRFGYYNLYLSDLEIPIQNADGTRSQKVIVKTATGAINVE